MKEQEILEYLGWKAELRSVNQSTLAYVLVHSQGETYSVGYHIDSAERAYRCLRNLDVFWDLFLRWCKKNVIPFRCGLEITFWFEIDWPGARIQRGGNSLIEAGINAWHQILTDIGEIK